MDKRETVSVKVIKYYNSILKRYSAIFICPKRTFEKIQQKIKHKKKTQILHGEQVRRVNLRAVSSHKVTWETAPVHESTAYGRATILLTTILNPYNNPTSYFLC